MEIFTADVKYLPKGQPKFAITSLPWFEGLDYVGQIAIINSPLLAVFSSAKCPASSILKAHDYGKKIRNDAIGIISGFHTPAEKKVLEFLLKGVCPIIIALGRRLEGARILVVWKKAGCWSFRHSKNINHM